MGEQGNRGRVGRPRVEDRSIIRSENVATRVTKEKAEELRLLAGSTRSISEVVRAAICAYMRSAK